MFGIPVDYLPVLETNVDQGIIERVPGQLYSERIFDHILSHMKSQKDHLVKWIRDRSHFRISSTDGTVLNFILGNKLGSGTFGTVYSLSVYDRSMGYKFGDVALKLVTLEPDNHGESELDLDAIDCGVVEVIKLQQLQYIGEKKEDIFPLLMPLAQGDLVKLMKLFMDSRGGHDAYLVIVSKIIRQISTQIICLQESGYFYYDVKPGNCVFFYTTSSQIDFKLCDLGSLSTVQDMFMVSHPPWLHDSKDEELKSGFITPSTANSDKYIAYVFGVFCLNLLFKRSNLLSFNEIGDMTFISYQTRIDHLLLRCEKKYERYRGDLIRQYLEGLIYGQRNLTRDEMLFTDPDKVQAS